MPIIIKKGSDHEKKRKAKRKDLKRDGSGSSLPEAVDCTNIATDMTDVLDFKVYRVIKPNFYNNTTKVNLIGEEFYRDDEIDAAADPCADDTQVDQKKDDTVRPSKKVLKDFATPKYDAKFVDILTRMKESERTANLIKNGHSIAKSLTPPTEEETLQWAVKFVLSNSEALVLHVIDLYYQLKDVEPNLESLAKNYRSERPRSLSEDSRGRDRTQSSFSEDNASGTRSRTQSTDVTRSGGQVVPRPPSRERGGPSDSTKGSSIRRASSRLLSVTGANDLALGAAGDRLNATQHSRNKHVSLAQQLEQIRIQGTDSFIKAITPHKESIFPHGKRNWKQQASSKASLDASTLSLHNPQPTPKLAENARKVSIIASVASKMMPSSPPPVASPTPSDSHTSLKHPAPPASPRPSSSSTAGGANGPPRRASRSERVMAPAAAPAGSGGTGGSSGAGGSGAGFSATIYKPEASPTNSPRPAAPVSPRPGPPTKKSGTIAAEMVVDHSHRILTALLKKTTAIQSTIAARLHRAEKKGNKVVRLNKEFDQKVQRSEAEVGCLFEGREFARPITLLHQIESYALENTEEDNRGSVRKDMRRMRERAGKKTQELYTERLLEHRWFLAMLLRLRGTMKKTSNAVPVCCLQFVVALQQVLIMGYTLTHPMFYTLLEATVVNKEDHLKALVHQLLKIAREVVDISAAEFLAYLESKDISPNPELINQVRAQNKAKRMSSTGSVRLTIIDQLAGEGSESPGKKAPGKVEFAPETRDVHSSDGSGGVESPVSPTSKGAVAMAVAAFTRGGAGSPDGDGEEGIRQVNAPLTGAVALQPRGSVLNVEG